MERFPKMDSIELVEKYNFKEMMELKERMLFLCHKMKAFIESDKYQTLISDEVGGRIPTLILRRILKLKNPDKNIRTIFLASGKWYLPSIDEQRYQEYTDFLKKEISTDENVLLVTQYVHNGGTIKSLAEIIKDAGIKHLDVAIARCLFTEDGNNLELPADNVFIGEQMSKSEKIDDESVWYTGVAKRADKKFIFPSPLSKIIEEEERGGYLTEEQGDVLFGITGGENHTELLKKLNNEESKKRFDDFKDKPLTEEEKVLLTQQVRKTREDINTLAEEIYKEVWR